MAAAIDPGEAKGRQRAMWALGDYDASARVFAPSADVLLRAAGVAAGMDVLDVATGTGNVALAAARAGARVTGCDLTPALLAIARARAEEDGLEVAWHEADVEALPFADASFDAVLSSFGAMFAPRPEVAAAELFRVLRPGGVAGLLSWTPEGSNGPLLAVMRDHLPQPPGTPRPDRWGEEAFMRTLLAPHASSVEFSRDEVVWRFPSREAARAFHEEKVPPAIALRRALPPERYSEALAALEAAQEPFITEEPDGIVMPAEYLVTIARG